MTVKKEFWQQKAFEYDDYQNMPEDWWPDRVGGVGITENHELGCAIVAKDKIHLAKIIDDMRLALWTASTTGEDDDGTAPRREE